MRHLRLMSWDSLEKDPVIKLRILLQGNKPGKHSQRVSEYVSRALGKAQTWMHIVDSKNVCKITTMPTEISDRPHSYSVSFFQKALVAPGSSTLTPAETILKAKTANPQSGHNDFPSTNSNPILSGATRFSVWIIRIRWHKSEARSESTVGLNI